MTLLPGQERAGAHTREEAVKEIARGSNEDVMTPLNRRGIDVQFIIMGATAATSYRSRKKAIAHLLNQRGEDDYIVMTGRTPELRIDVAQVITHDEDGSALQGTLGKKQSCDLIGMIGLGKRNQGNRDRIAVISLEGREHGEQGKLYVRRKSI